MKKVDFQNRDILTTNEAASRLGLSRSTFEKGVAAGLYLKIMLPGMSNPLFSFEQIYAATLMQTERQDINANTLD